MKKTRVVVLCSLVLKGKKPPQTQEIVGHFNVEDEEKFSQTVQQVIADTKEVLGPRFQNSLEDVPHIILQNLIRLGFEYEPHKILVIEPSPT
jgi:hypothetical protein